MSALVGALEEPTVAPPARWVVALSLANLGVYTGWFGPIQVLLAEQAKVISPDHKEQLLGWVLGIGAFVSTVCNPLFGAFSDRTTSRRGRRVPWVFGGVAVGSVCLGVLSVTHSALLMVLAWAGVQASLNAMYAAITAAVPDQVPVQRRGLVGGCLAIAQTFGVVLGVGIAAATGSIAAGYLASITVMVALALPYLFGSRDVPLPVEYEVERFRLGPFLRGFWISPRQHPDFAWAWGTRFLATVGNSIATLYLLYYVTDALGFSDDEGPNKVFVMTVLYAACLVVTTVVGGIWSDRTGRRKSFVIWSGLVAGAAALLLAIPQTYGAAILASIVLGLGFGIYLAVDFALITQVLPGAEGRAKDLGVINIANALPQAIAPVIAGTILGLVRTSGGSVATHGESWSLGYALVYVFAFVMCVLGSVFVTRIRSVA